MKTIDDKRYAKERIKQLQPRAQKPAKKPWRESKNHTSEFESDVKRLKATALRNAELYRINMLPRSYDERVADIHH